MMKKNFQIEHEINFIELFQIIWQSKWKMVVIVVTSVLSTFIYQANQPKIFTATTEIVPITTFEENKYILFNRKITDTLDSKNELLLEYFEKSPFLKSNKNDAIKTKSEDPITKFKLLNLYIEVLNEKKLFKKAIRELNLLDSSQYSNELDFDAAITNLASTIKIFKPIENKKKDYDFYSTIEFSYHDSAKWREVLQHVSELANKKIQQNLRKKFQTYLTSAKQDRENSIDDLDIKINNAITDYYRLTSDRIEYLKEQAAIAKKLGIAKNTIEVQTFGNQNALLSNIKTDSPFYLRGYEAINKEIELINLRTNNKAFINGLVDLEQKKRSIIQDKTLERNESIFLSSPISNKDFYAATIDILATKFQYKNEKKILLISLIFGLIIGAIYILIDNTIRSQNISIKK